MSKKQKLIALFPELTLLIEETVARKIHINLTQPLRLDEERNFRPHQVMLSRSTRSYGSIEVMLRKFDPEIKYAPTQNKHIITVKTIKFTNPKFTYDKINTDDPLETIKFIQSYFNDMDNSK